MFNLFTNPVIAHHPDHLTINWAQHVLNQVEPGKKVDQVEILSVDIGTTTRIRVEVSHNGTQSIPRKWFVKIPSLSWRARAITALPRLLHTEIRFYNELADIMPVTKPTALSAHTTLCRGSTLVLNDLSEQGAIPGEPGDELSIEQALLVIEQMAIVHALFWNKADTNMNYRWLAGSVRRLEDHLGSVLAVPLMKLGLSKAGDIVPHALHKSAIYYARHRRQAMKFLSQGVQTIIHHDCHPGNLFWQDARPGLLDWQMIRIGEGISDIAYFIATSLSSEIRRENEGQLINHYVQCLSELGVTKIDREQIQQRYNAQLVYPFEAMLLTLAVGGMMDLKANLKLIERTASAVEDSSAFAYLPI